MKNLIICIFASFIIFLLNYRPKSDPEIIVKYMTIYRDTCDSKFFKTMLEIESGAISLSAMDSCYTQACIQGEGGAGKGHLGIYDVCVTGSGLHKVLGYTHESMFDLESSSHVFWSMMGLFYNYYYSRHKEAPSYEILARMWSGGPTGYQRESTKNYLKKFRELWNEDKNSKRFISEQVKK